MAVVEMSTPGGEATSPLPSHWASLLPVLYQLSTFQTACSGLQPKCVSRYRPWCFMKEWREGAICPRGSGPFLMSKWAWKVKSSHTHPAPLQCSEPGAGPWRMTTWIPAPFGLQVLLLLKTSVLYLLSCLFPRTGPRNPPCLSMPPWVSNILESMGRNYSTSITIVE